MVRSEKSPALIGFGENALLTLAPGRLVNDASVGCGLLAPLVVVTAFAGIVLVRLPLTVIVMLMVKVQVPNGGKFPPLNEKEPFPDIAVIVPPQVPTDEMAGVATIIPAGILSVNAIPTRLALFGLTSSTLMVEAEPPNTVRGLNSFTTPMDRSVIVNGAVASAIGLITVEVPWIVPLTFAVGMVLNPVPEPLP